MCETCGGKRIAVGATAFAEHVDDVVRKHTTPIVHPGPDDDHGEEPLALVKRVAGVDENLAARVLEVGRPRSKEDICHYDYNLSFVIAFAREHQQEWKRLRQVLRHEARFFGRETREILDRLLGDVEAICGGIATRELSPDDIIYRGRLERSQGEAEGFFKSPDVQLTAPLASRATPGRMNAPGIRVFYGALTEARCVAELRPPLSSRIVTGRFRPTRRLRIVDLGALGGAFSGAFEFADVFDPEFEALSGKLEFLRSLESEIARPVLPNDEALDYVTTQVVAEYLVHVIGLDGVAYRSAQAGGASQWAGIVDPRAEPNERNVALFGSAARTVAEQTAGEIPGLRFEADSQHMLNVAKIAITTEENMWAHYEDPPLEADD